VLQNQRGRTCLQTWCQPRPTLTGKRQSLGAPCGLSFQKAYDPGCFTLSHQNEFPSLTVSLVLLQNTRHIWDTRNFHTGQSIKWVTVIHTIMNCIQNQTLVETAPVAATYSHPKIHKKSLTVVNLFAHETPGDQSGLVFTVTG
jgi:hypothetical protein